MNVIPGSRLALAAACTALLAASASAQNAPPDSASRPSSLTLAIHDYGLGIGDAPHINGVRLNFRDRAPFVVNGINATVWTPISRSRHRERRRARRAGHGSASDQRARDRTWRGG